MADTVVISGSISAKIDGTGFTAGMAQTGLSRNLAAVSEATSGFNTMSASWQALSFGAVDMTELSLLSLINLSAVDGEDITVGKPGNPGTGLVLDATPTIAGASVPATLSAAGKYRTISADGTSQSIDWKVGDLAIYLGSSGVWCQVKMTEFALLRGADVTGFFTAFPVKADGQNWFVKTATGTPRLANIAVGALE